MVGEGGGVRKSLGIQPVSIITVLFLFVINAVKNDTRFSTSTYMSQAREDAHGFMVVKADA